MASWGEFADQEPELAALARWFLDANKHKILGTLRADGSPRLSGTETQFCLGALYLGTMAGAVRIHDLRRDPRCALHTSSADPGPDNAGWDGDAKIAGRATEVTDPEEVAAWAAELEQSIEDIEAGGFHLFKIDVDEVVVTGLNDARTGLIVDLWTPTNGRKKFDR
ncbi:MAG: pyridoxamine 5-phosphate oxidase [Actinomycetia bacterium]|nr:pyridoxamine 5-phosphate oxidase [Actinomycetes bacterium]